MKCAISTLTWFVVVAALSGCGGATDGGGGAGKAEPAMSGEQVYGQFCFSCHATGAAGAPMVGDAAAWAPRIAQGEEVMLKRSIEGIAPGMPPRGLCSRCTDADLAAAIGFMTSQSE